MNQTKPHLASTTDCNYSSLICIKLRYRRHRRYSSYDGYRYTRKVGPRRIREKSLHKVDLIYESATQNED
jgi:hypothetical protein